MATTRNRTAHAPTVRNASGNYIVSRSLADPEVAGQLKALRERMNKHPEERIAFFKEAGILNRAGKTSKKYGG